LPPIAIHCHPSPSIATHRHPLPPIAIYCHPSPSIATHRHLLPPIAIYCHPSPSIASHCLLLPFVHRRPNPRCSSSACTISAPDQNTTKGMRKPVIYKSSVSGHVSKLQMSAGS
jgi:hypothetical protein